MFFSKRAIENDIADWIEDRFAILLEHFAAEKAVSATELVLPGANAFIVDGETDEDRAKQLYEVTAGFAGFGDWPVKLVAMGDEGPRHLSQGVILQSGNTAAGTFSVDEHGEVEITFSRDLLPRPTDLVATFAHELAHMLLHARGVEEGIHTEDAELVTDLAAVYLGFGVFLANSAFEYEQFMDGAFGGWSSKRQGYLSEDTLTYATALFCSIKGDGFEEARAALKPRLSKVFDRAIDQLQKRGGREGLYKLDQAKAD